MMQSWYHPSLNMLDCFSKRLQLPQSERQIVSDVFEILVPKCSPNIPRFQATRLQIVNESGAVVPSSVLAPTARRFQMVWRCLKQIWSTFKLWIGRFTYSLHRLNHSVLSDIIFSRLWLACAASAGSGCFKRLGHLRKRDREALRKRVWQIGWVNDGLGK